MKKLFILMVAGAILASCTTADPKCKQSHKRLKKMGLKK